MTLKYSLDLNDYLQFQLYTASKSKRIKNKRLKSLLIVMGMFLMLAVLFFQKDETVLMYYFIGCSVLSLIFYPLYLRNHYKKHYQRFIAENYKFRFNEECVITFNENTIETIDRTGESKINVSEIEEIAEVNNYIYLKMKTGGALIVCKDKVENPHKVREFFKTLTQSLKINYDTELNWKWK
jgi:hypothetical protein